ncbi:hypothetical protein [Streptomyces sp. NPDC101166]
MPGPDRAETVARSLAGLLDFLDERGLSDRVPAFDGWRTREPTREYL